MDACEPPAKDFVQLALIQRPFIIPRLTNSPRLVVEPDGADRCGAEGAGTALRLAVFLAHPQRDRLEWLVFEIAVEEFAVHSCGLVD